MRGRGRNPIAAAIFLIVIGIVCVCGSVPMILNSDAAEAVVTGTELMGGRNSRKIIYYVYTVDGNVYEGRDSMKISFKRTGDKFTVYYRKSNPSRGRDSDALWLETAIGMSEILLGVIVILLKAKLIGQGAERNEDGDEWAAEYLKIIKNTEKLESEKAEDGDKTAKMAAISGEIMGKLEPSKREAFSAITRMPSVKKEENRLDFLSDHYRLIAEKEKASNKKEDESV